MSSYGLRIKRIAYISLIVMWLSALFTGLTASPQEVSAATTLPTSVYISQQSTNTCTLAATVMAIRARAFLSGYDGWANITEEAVKPAAWTSSGLSFSFTYSFNGNSITVGHQSISGGMSLSALKNVMNAHPEGIALYCVANGQKHAVYITDIEGDTVYCADPASSYAHTRRTLDSSLLGVRYGSQSSILNNVIAYWYISSYNISITGGEMQSGYDRILPDGDYAIVSAKDPQFILTAEGGKYPAQNETNIQIYGVSNPSNYNVAHWDAWTITYDNGFYWIRQRGTNLALTVYHGSLVQGDNVYIAYDNGSSAQKWAISYSNDGRKGYHLQAKCSSFYLNIADRNMVSGNNVNQYGSDGTDSQGWMFIPYNPSQTLAAGRYILVSDVNSAYELDVEGDTGNVGNGTNVALWNHNSTAFYEQSLSQYNSFDVVPLANGYYKLIHVASGKGLALLGGGVSDHQNIGIYEENGDSAHEWAITPHGNNDGFVLRPKCSGLAMEAANSTLANGTNVFQSWYTGAKTQTWQFVPAEYTVSYNANGGTGAPSTQTKYYKGKLLLTETVPTREGYTFAGWATSANATTAAYHPGDVYSMDANVTFYAVWEKEQYTVSYDANTSETVTDLPSNQTKTYNTALMLSSTVPKRTGYDFLGWAVSPSGNVVYTPGDSYTDNSAITLYAVWQKQNFLTLPSSLIEIEEEAFIGCGASVVIVPQGCEEIGPRAFAECNALTDIYIPSTVINIHPTAFSGCSSNLVIHGNSGSAAESFAQVYGFVFEVDEP